jgi:hypothetical protein
MTEGSRPVAAFVCPEVMREGSTMPAMAQTMPRRAKIQIRILTTFTPARLDVSERAAASF